MTSTENHSSSTGHAMAASNWLDAHFRFAQPEYEAQARMVGIRPGWRVLDAGCGGGSFLPLLAELVGPGGMLTALDLAPENVSTVEALAANGALACPVEAHIGGVTALPFADATFDALWCANVSQYLTDGELAATLAEFRRVVRPGGLIAIKDSDANVMNYPHRVPGLFLRSRVARLAASDPGLWGVLRTPHLREALLAVGLDEVWQRTSVIERSGPFTPEMGGFVAAALRSFAAQALAADLPAADRVEWTRLRDEAVQEVVDPAFNFREGNVLAVGRVPQTAAEGAR